jgi:carboxyl-terminal processing protease
MYSQSAPPQIDVAPRGRRTGPRLLYVALLIVVLFGGIAIGQRMTSPGSTSSTPNTSPIDLTLFNKVFDIIQREYVDAPAENESLEFGAIRGLVAGLNDPNSNFMDPEETQAFHDNLAGKFSGVGLELATRDEQLTVVTPLSDSPAERAEIKSGDIILAIDDVDTSSLSLDESVLKIRGPAGTVVRLLIHRKDAFDAKEFKLTREEINITSLESEIRTDNIGIISINRFGEDTADAMNNATNDFLSKGVKGIVLDLRGNPGGFLETSVDVASYFVNDGVIVTEEFGDGNKQEYKAKGNARLKDMPLVVLIDNGSASAAEILAGALQDYGRAQLIGVKSFGKGSVQELMPLEKNTSLRLTVAEFVLPKGRHINHVGIDPDVVVELSSEDIEAERDPQLDKALEVLREQL